MNKQILIIGKDELKYLDKIMDQLPGAVLIADNENKDELEGITEEVPTLLKKEHFELPTKEERHQAKMERIRKRRMK